MQTERATGRPLKSPRWAVSVSSGFLVVATDNEAVDQPGQNGRTNGRIESEASQQSTEVIEVSGIRPVCRRAEGRGEDIQQNDES